MNNKKNIFTSQNSTDVQQIKQYRINDVIEFIQILKELEVSPRTMIYRGQANSKWDIISSAYRKLRDESSNGNVTPMLLKDYHSKLIDGVRRLHDIAISNEDDITILAQLQHNKAETILIDYTYNPLAALWFACYDKQNEKADGCVYAIEPTFTQDIFPLKRNDLESLFKSTEVTYIYHPYQINQRIINQQSVFLTRWLGKIDKSQQVQIVVPKAKKKSIIQELQVLGITKKTLFQDFIGYIDTFEYDMDNKSQCSNFVFQAREIIESDKPSYNDAKSLLNKALELTSSYKSNKEKAYILHELGYVSYKIGDYVEAISYYDKAMQKKKRYSTETNFDIVQTEVAKGLSFIKMGKYKLALPLFEKALSLAPPIENNPSFTVDILINIANINRELGAYDKAKEPAEKAECIAVKHFGAESKKNAYIINCVGSVYAKIAREKDAKDKFETALRIFKQSPSRNILDMVYTYLKMASLYNLNTTGIVKGQSCLKKGIELLKKLPEDSLVVKRSLAHAKTIQAKYSFLSGEYDDAIKYCDEAFELSKDFDENHPKMIETEIIYGDALYAKKKYPDAMTSFMKAVKKLQFINLTHPDIDACTDKIKCCKEYARQKLDSSSV